jgi:hypothetical protein
MKRLSVIKIPILGILAAYGKTTSEIQEAVYPLGIIDLILW